MSDVEKFAEVLHNALIERTSDYVWCDETVDVLTAALLASPAMAERDARVRADALREAANEVWVEMRWQTEQARFLPTPDRHIHKYALGRLEVLLDILRGRAGNA